jgi:hypothetical protein
VEQVEGAEYSEGDLLLARWEKSVNQHFVPGDRLPSDHSRAESESGLSP